MARIDESARSGNACLGSSSPGEREVASVNIGMVRFLDDPCPLSSGGRYSSASGVDGTKRPVVSPSNGLQRRAATRPSAQVQFDRSSRSLYSVDRAGAYGSPPRFHSASEAFGVRHPRDRADGPVWRRSRDPTPTRRGAVVLPAAGRSTCTDPDSAAPFAGRDGKALFAGRRTGAWR